MRWDVTAGEIHLSLGSSYSCGCICGQEESPQSQLTPQMTLMSRLQTYSGSDLNQVTSDEKLILFAPVLWSTGRNIN